MAFRFLQHLPAYFDDSIARFDITVENTEELLRYPKIDGWKRNHQDFYRFVQSKYGDNLHLMAEHNNGKSWYVLGTAFTEDLGLPQWEPKKD